MQTFAGRRLIIFGCGYVGSALAEASLAAGASVTALTRNALTADALRRLGAQVVVGDLAEAAWHASIPGGADYAVNCVSSGGGGLEAYRRSYVGGMASIAAWAGAREVGTLVYTSSTSVYPQGDGQRIDEDAVTAPASERAALLLETEATVRRPGSGWAHGVVLRLAGIYGPGRHHLLDQVRAGEVAGRPETHLNVIHRDDIVSAILACLTISAKGAGGVFNLADDAPATKGEVVHWLAERLGVAVPRFTGAPVGTRGGLTPDRIIDNSRIKAALGWRPTHPTFRSGYGSLLSH